jgi:pyruvate carboxylase
MDLEQIKKDLADKFGGATECDVASYAMYPKVFEDYKKFVAKYGDLSVLPTKYFLARPEIGEEFHVELQRGKVLILKLLAVGPLSEQTGQREVFYEMNGEVRQVAVDDKKAAVENLSRPKADTGDSSQVGAPMSGVVVEVRVRDGGEVRKGDPIAVLSAMKMVRIRLVSAFIMVEERVANGRLGDGHLRAALWRRLQSAGQGGRLGR